MIGDRGLLLCRRPAPAGPDGPAEEAAAVGIAAGAGVCGCSSGVIAASSAAGDISLTSLAALKVGLVMRPLLVVLLVALLGYRGWASAHRAHVQ